MAVRADDKPPAYFQDKVKLNPVETKLRTKDFTRTEKQVALYEEKLDQVGKEREEVKEILDHKRQQQADSLEQYFKDLEATAQQTVTKEAQQLGQ